MTLLTLLGIVSALLSSAGSAAPEERGVRRVIVHNELILRVPVRPRPPDHIEWVERKGPKCVPSQMIAGATLSGPSSIDFMLRNRKRVRAVMGDECPALDFYNGFYLQPDDERICAKRETVRSRVGASCRIERFRLLEPQPKR